MATLLFVALLGGLITGLSPWIVPVLPIAVRFTTYAGRYMYHCQSSNTKTATRCGPS